MNKRNMKTSFLLSFALCLSFFATANNTNPDSTDLGASPELMSSTELSIGINNPFAMSFGSPNVLSSKSELGWQVGVLRKHPINAKVDMVFGMLVTKISQKVAFTDETVAYKDKGVRDYMNYYVQMPIFWQFKLGKEQKTFARIGGGLSYMVNNQSFESLNRTHFLDDEGAKLNPTIQQVIYEYREVSPFDLQLRVAIGKNFQFGKAKSNISIGYTQGLLSKDMGFRTGQLECMLGITLY
jgi:Outer membrane protein beta-barrel domain